MTTPLTNLSWATSFDQNLTLGNWIYSGRFAAHAQQWGAYAVNVDVPNSFSCVSPVVGPGPGYQQPALTRCNGDFHQSAQMIFASANTPKWVMTTLDSLGSHFGCAPEANPSKVQFYRLGAGGLSYHGQLFVDCFGSSSAIIGDIAYVDQGDGTWRKVDIENLGDMGPTTVMPDHPVQLDIDGYTYGPVLVPSPKHFTAARQGGTIPVPTLPKFCGRDFISRQEMAAFLLSLNKWMVEHPGQVMPVPPQPCFSDYTDPADPFYGCVNAIGAAGISAGKNVCAS